MQKPSTIPSAINFLLWGLTLFTLPLAAILAHENPESGVFKLVTLFQYSILFYICLFGDRRHLALLLIYIFSSGLSHPALWFDIGANVNFRAEFGQDFRSKVPIGMLKLGLGWTYPRIICFTALLRLILDLFTGRSFFCSFKDKKLMIIAVTFPLLFVWGVIAIFWTTGGEVGRAHGISAVTTLCAFYLGVQIAVAPTISNSRRSDFNGLVWLLGLIALVGVAATLRLIVSGPTFALIPILIGCFFFVIFVGSNSFLKLCSAVFLIYPLSILLLGGSITQTLAVMSSFVGCIIVLFFWWLRLRVPVAMLITSGAVVAFVLYAFIYQTSGSVDARGLGKREDVGIVQYGYYKLYEDRGRLWNQITDDIRAENPVLAAPGRAFYVYHPGSGLTYWIYGPHSTYLFALFNLGLVAGSFLIISMGVILWRAWLQVQSLGNVHLECLVASIVCSVLSTAITLDGILMPNLGCLLFLVLGYCAFSSSESRARSVLR